MYSRLRLNEKVSGLNLLRSFTGLWAVLLGSPRDGIIRDRSYEKPVDFREKGFRWEYASELGWDGAEEIREVAQRSVALGANERRRTVPLDRVRASDSLGMRPILF